MPTFLAGVFEGPAEREINDLRAIPGALCGKGQILRLPRYGAYNVSGEHSFLSEDCLPLAVECVLRCRRLRPGAACSRGGATGLCNPTSPLPPLRELFDLVSSHTFCHMGCWGSSHIQTKTSVSVYAHI